MIAIRGPGAHRAVAHASPEIVARRQILRDTGRPIEARAAAARWLVDNGPGADRGLAATFLRANSAALEARTHA